MRNALLGAIFGAIISIGVLFGTGALSDDEAPPATTAQPPAATQGGDPRPKAAATDVGRIYESAGPATVSVLTEGGGGTGFLVDADGTIVTNAHVVGNARQVVIRFGPDGERLEGTVKGSDSGSDLAIVSIDRGEIPDGVRPLELADSDKVGVGETAVAIGNPFGLPRTATVGIVSALGRTIQAPNGFSIPGAIQTDAAINPGNSGGPLLDGQGRVIGVNSQIETSSGGNVGIGFAVPSNTVRDVVPELRKDGRVRRGYLGVSTGPATEGDGAEVGAVVAGGPAAEAGLRPGDVIVEIGGEKVLDSDDVIAEVSERRSGETVKVVVRRGGDRRALDVELGEQPQRAQQPTPRRPR